MYKLDKSTLSASMWRGNDVGNLLPLPVKAGELTDQKAIRIVACAKMRLDMCTPGKTNGIDYAKLVVSHNDLKGICFVAADEFERFFNNWGYDAKAVRVRPVPSGGDHYFTVLKKTSAKDALIVDGTWRQFHVSGPALNYFLVGTLDNLRQALGATNAGSLLDMYAAGLDVLKQWQTYSCFAS